MRRGVVALLLAGACSTDGAIVDREVDFVPAAVGTLDAIELPGIARALLALDGGLLIGTDSGLLLQRGSDAPTAIDVRRFSANEPEATGAIRALAARPNGGVLVAAENGLFTWDGQRLARSPATDVVASPVAVDASSIGGNEHVAVVGRDGTVAWIGPVSGEWVASANADPRPAIAFANGALWVSVDDKLVRIQGAEGNVELPRELGSGPIVALEAAPDGTLWVLARDGVLRRSGEGEAWQRWSMENGTALTLDPDGAGAWIAVGREVRRIGLGEAPSLSVFPGAGAGALAIDRDGVLWSADDLVPRITRSPGLGAPAPSFEADVASIAERSCAGCHGESASLPLVRHDQWSRNAQRILLELRVGAMPKGSRLAASDVRVVERWVEGGLLP